MKIRLHITNPNLTVQMKYMQNNMIKHVIETMKLYAAQKRKPEPQEC